MKTQNISVLVDNSSFVDSRVTPEGIQLLDSNPTLAGAIRDFGSRSEHPGTIFSQFEAIGNGKNARVYLVGGVAVKVSTAELTAKGYDKDITEKPEVLTHHHSYLRALGRYLTSRTNGKMSTPDQYLALQTADNRFIQVQEYLDGWQSLKARIEKDNLGFREENKLMDEIARKIGKDVGSSWLRHGLTDLGLSDTLSAQNVLVPKDAPIDGDTLRIIDQPGRGLKGRFAAWLAVRK